MLILSKFLSFISIWTNLVSKSSYLKFSKLTEIWDKRIFLYACYNVNVYFSKIFVIHIFWDKFGSINLKFYRMTEISYRGKLLYAYYDFNVYFSKVLSVRFFGHIGS